MKSKTLVFLLSVLLPVLCRADEKKIVAVYDLAGVLSETGQASGGLPGLSMDAERPLAHLDVVRSLEKAAADERVAAVVLEVDQAGIGLAQLQEMRRLLLKARGQGKDVWLYTEGLGFGTALLASASNHAVLMPEGGVDLSGLYAESMYFKGLLDKFGVAADVVHIGDFKSAGETFCRTGPSEPARKQEEELLDGMFTQLVRQVAEGRGIGEGAMRALVDKGVLTPEEAKAGGLVNHLEYRTDLVARLRKTYKGADFDRNYGLPDRSGPEINGFMDLMKLAFSSRKKKKSKGDYIAVVPFEGTISDASIVAARDAILRAKRDGKCRGLVLRVDSPGGSALASEVLWEAADEFQRSKRPFVASMGGVAASGGYYISSGAEKIYAEKGTITGSIGVVGMKIALGGAMEKAGITTHEMKRGNHADIWNTTRPFSEKERELVRKSMLDVYGTFKKRVADGRGDRLKGDLESLAGGRVYIGEKALALGLVDELGGLSDALAFVRGKLGKPDLEARLLPEPVSPMEVLFQKPEKRGDDEEFIRAGGEKRAPLIDAARLEAHPVLRLLDGAKKRQVAAFLRQLEAFRGERVLLIAPHAHLARPF